MSDDDVSPGEMYEPHDPRGDSADQPAPAGVEADTAGLLADMRIAYASTPPAVRVDLAALIHGSPAPAATPTPRRFERMRSSIIAKVGAATAAVVAATGGLAVAGALPAPVQDAMSHIGIGTASHDSNHTDSKDETTTTTVDPTATTVPTVPTNAAENHGTGVSGVAHDPSSDACEHGHDVANIASDGQANGQPCETPTSIEDGHDGNGTNDTSGDHHSGDANGSSGDTNSGDTNGGDHNGTSPTTVEQSHDGGDSTSGSGDSNTSGSGGDQSGSNSSDGGSGGSGGGN